MQPAAAADGVGAGLLVSAAWIAEHAPGLSNVSTVLAVSECGRSTIRAIRAYNDYNEEEVRAEVKYDLPPVGGESADERHVRADRHRRREEAAIRQLDGVAAVEHQHKKARLARESRHEGDERAREVAELRTLCARTLAKRRECVAVSADRTG